MLPIFIALATLGFIISLYAYITERKVKDDPNYKAACDLSDTVSCTKPMQSEYANLFFISNSFLGMAFYACIATLAFFDAAQLLFFASLMSCVFTCYLAYVLYFKIKSLCIICTSLYIINFSLLALSIWTVYF